MFYSTKKYYNNSLLIQESLFRYYQKTLTPTTSYTIYMEIWLILISCILLGGGLCYTVFAPAGYALLWLLFPMTQVVFFYTPLPLVYWFFSISLIVFLYSLRFSFFLSQELKNILTIEYGFSWKYFMQLSLKHVKQQYVLLFFIVFLCLSIPKIGILFLWLLPFISEYYCTSYLVNRYFKTQPIKFYPTQFSILLGVGLENLNKTHPIFLEHPQFFERAADVDIFNTTLLGSERAHHHYFEPEDYFFLEFVQKYDREDLEDDYWTEDEIIYGSRNNDSLYFKKVKQSEETVFTLYPRSFYATLFIHYPESYLKYLANLKLPSGYTNYYAKFLYPLTSFTFFKKQFLISSNESLYDEDINPGLNFEWLNAASEYLSFFESDAESVNLIGEQNIRARFLDYYNRAKRKRTNLHPFHEQTNDFDVFGPDVEAKLQEIGAGDEFKEPNWCLVSFFYQTFFFFGLLNGFCLCFFFFFGVVPDWLDMGRDSSWPDYTLGSFMIQNTELLATHWGYLPLHYKSRREYFEFLGPAFYYIEPRFCGYTLLTSFSPFGLSNLDNLPDEILIDNPSNFVIMTSLEDLQNSFLLKQRFSIWINECLNISQKTTNILHNCLNDVIKQKVSSLSTFSLVEVDSIVHVDNFTSCMKIIIIDIDGLQWEIFLKICDVYTIPCKLVFKDQYTSEYIQYLTHLKKIYNDSTLLSKIFSWDMLFEPQTRPHLNGGIFQMFKELLELPKKRQALIDSYVLNSYRSEILGELEFISFSQKFFPNEYFKGSFYQDLSTSINFNESFFLKKEQQVETFMNIYLDYAKIASR